jgi:phosphoribosylamine--glycine ligase
MTQHVLVIGGGGREHAIVANLAADERCTVVNAARNRNPAIIDLVAAHAAVDETDPTAIADAAAAWGVDAAIVGPERSLAAGVVDALSADGIDCFGPTASLARIETDKTYQRRLMADAGIPGCPRFESFSDPAAAASYLEDIETPMVIKPAGLTGGKGVLVIGEHLSHTEAIEHLRTASYDAVVLEERLVGEEFTLQAFVANGSVVHTPLVQDHKRAFRGDRGPNTGGMGAYSMADGRLPFVREADYTAAVDILDQTVAALPGYTGILYGQFMVTASGVYVIEFNARFGDPEAMNVLSIMEGSLWDLITAAAAGDPLPQPTFAPQATVVRYLVPAGYPADPDEGVIVDLGALEDAVSRLYVASVDAVDADRVRTTTSRAVAVVGKGPDLAAAATAATFDPAVLSTDGLRFRDDIGTPAAVEARRVRMQELRADVG